MACQTREGTRLSKSGYYAKRAGLFHLYRIYGKTQSKEFQDDMKVVFKGFLRTVAQEVQNGDGRITTGKLPLSFELYCEICKWMMEDTTAAGRFAHLFLVLSWNLACRSSNTVTIHFHHMKWMNDSLQIFFAHQKNDPTGTRPRDPRHIYCNPYNPAICPILTLVSYLLVTPPSADTQLFPGSHQYNRYNKYLKKLLESKREYVLRKYGVNVDEIGAHSARKGASTYMTSGCVNGSMQQAVNIRCGWRMGGVTDTYCRYEAAGDQYCGRIVSGLPLFSFRFAVLPPKFKLETELENDMLSDLILTLFPEMVEDLWAIVRYGLASLAFRETWLRENLPANHCIFESCVWWNENFHEIKNNVELKLGVGDKDLEVDQVQTGEINCTGIPTHTVLLSSQRDVILQQRRLIKSNSEIPGMITTAVQNSGMAPGAEMQAMIAELRNVGGGLIQQLQGLRINEGVEQVQQEQGGNHTVRLYHHEGRFIRIPPDFEFPKKCSLRDIFFRFHLHSTVDNIPPLKTLDSISMRHIRRGKQVLSDLRYLMAVLDAEAERKRLSTQGLRTQLEASEIFEQIKEAVYKHHTTSKRKETLKWQTWVQKCRKNGATRIVNV